GMRLIQWNLPPNLVPFPELIDGVVGLHDLELQRMLVLPGKSERVRILQRRVGRVLEIRFRTATRSLSLHALERPRSIGNIRFGPRRRSRRTPRAFASAQPHTRNVGVLRRHGGRGPVGTTGYENDSAQQPSQPN